MLYLRLLGSALLLLSAALAAKYMNKRAEARVTELGGFLRLIREIRLEVDSFSLPISKIFERIDKDIFIACGYEGDLPPSSLEELCSAIEFKGERCQKLMFGLATDFGSGYRDEELRRLSYYEKELSDELQRLSGELPSKKKINLTLCISAAIAIVILMI